MESRKVLIAEDDPSVRKAVQRVLALEKYDVTAVNDGQAALEELSKTRFDLAVLDVMMPFADGLTVCREARHRGIQTPILLLTARVEVGDRVAGLDAGADDYLVKPFVIVASVHSRSQRLNLICLNFSCSNPTQLCHVITFTKPSGVMTSRQIQNHSTYTSATCVARQKKKARVAFCTPFAVWDTR